MPLCFQPYWLDSCAHEWDVLYSNIEGYSAFWVYHLERKLTFTFIRIPHLTPYTGLFFCEENIKKDIKSKLVNDLMSQIPKADVLEIDLSLCIDVDLKFQQYEVSNKRTNLLNLLDRDHLYSNFKPALKRQIKKAERSLTIYESDDIEKFYELHKKTFIKQNQEAKIPLSVYTSYWECTKQNKCGQLFFIEDEGKNQHASLWLAYDKNTAYYLAGGTDAKFYGSGAMSLLMWHAIQVSINLGKKTFDFEGSMLPNVDRFFKNFLPIEQNYLHIEKVNSMIYKLLKK